MKLLKKLFSIAFGLLLTMSVSSCKVQENKYIRLAVPETVDGTSLYLTGKATGLQGVANYILFEQSYDSKTYVDRVAEKLVKEKAGVDVAYFEVEDLNYLFSLPQLKGQLKIIYIDSFNEDGSIKSVWVSRATYMEKCPNYFPKFVKGLVKAADYRAKNSQKQIDVNGTSANGYSEIRNALINSNKNEGSWIYNLVDFTDYNFTDYTNVYEYCAIYSIQNEKKADNPKGVDDAKYSSRQSAIYQNNGYYYSLFNTPAMLSSDSSATEVAPKIQVLDDLLAEVGNDLSYADVYSLKAMMDSVSALKAEQESTTPEKKKNYTTAIILIAVGVVLLGLVIFFLVRRRIKTGKKLFDIKAALDVDIETYKEE